MDGYVPDKEWEQCLAEAKEKAGAGPVVAFFERKQYGWPVPVEGRGRVLRELAEFIASRP